MSATFLTGGFASVTPSPFYKTGWLTKKGHLVKNWKRRWFSISKSHIAYAADPAMKDIKGTIDLEDGASITTKVPRELLDLKYPFLFLLKPSKNAKNFFLLASDSIDDMLSWCATIHRCIQQLPSWRVAQLQPTLAPAAAKGKADTLALAGSAPSKKTALISALADSPALLLTDAMLLRILSYLNEVDLCRVCFVCSRWRSVAEEDSLWQGLVSRTYRFYRSNAKQQRWKNFYRDTPQLLPKSTAAGVAKASKHVLRNEPLNTKFLASDTGNRRGVFILTGVDQQKCTAFACQIRNPEHQAFLIAQTYILNVNSHPNLIRPLDLFIEKSFAWAACEGEMQLSLACLVESSNGPLPEDIIGCICCELLKAVSYLHALGYISGSVRSENVAFYPPNQVKLGAYAVTHALLPQNERLAGYCELTHWTPPEVYSKSGVSKAADIWQVGITALEMALLAPPYGQYSADRALQWMLSKGPPPLAGKQWSDDFKDWLAVCLHVDPAQRATYTSLLMHNFIAGKAAAPAKLQAFLSQERRDFISNFLS